MNFQALDPSLRSAVETSWRGLQETNPSLSEFILQQQHLRETLPRVWGASLFVRRTCGVLGSHGEEVLARVQAQGPAPNYQQEIVSAVSAPLLSESQQMAMLRTLRRDFMLRIAWRDLAGWATVDETLQDLTLLADALIQGAVHCAESHFQQAFGTPTSADGKVQQLITLAMGKLGGFELNFSSDVDLIFLYPESGTTSGPRSVSNEQYFQRVCQQVVKLLDQVTADGFVLRVDVRLRPFGSVGPLAMSFGAFENYLEAHGREWERYAYIKARPITGSSDSQDEVLQLLQPFVYRRYLDYGVFESIRGMKHTIIQEMKSSKTLNNIKLGDGGIREIEFIAQTLQLIRGGREQKLRQRSLIKTLHELGRQGMLNEAQVTELTESYWFLRRYENHLQQYDDQQTHDVPQDDSASAALALAMNLDPAALEETLKQHRHRVSGHFADIVVGPNAGNETPATTEDAASQDLKGMINDYKQGAQYRRLDKYGQRRIDALLPVVLTLVQKMDHPNRALRRVMRVFQAIGGRSAYFSLLLENRQVLERLLELCSRSVFLTNQISDHPILLDELIDHDSPFLQLSVADFQSGLSQRLEAESEQDLEYTMDALRHFQHASLFAIALRDLDGASIAKVSDQLTFLAEAVLDKVLNIAWDQAVSVNGRPQSETPEGLLDTQFAVIGYGKLGGYELGYSSDLDLVFLHNSTALRAETTGPKTMDNGRFFARMVQRMMHFLQTPTAAGILYQVDTRLRPSGRSGLLVSTLNAFENYQASEAWTWEHQALLRSRFVAGDKELGERFEAVRQRTLCQNRDPKALAQDVLEMRSKMRDESKSSDGFHLKQDVGGITDIEFIVQYLVLRWAKVHPELVSVTDNIRLLEGLAHAGILESGVQAELSDIYLTLRQRMHRLALDDRDSVVGEPEFASERKFVHKLWTKLLESEV